MLATAYRTALLSLSLVLVACGGDDGPPASDAGASDAPADDVVTIDAAAVVTGYVVSEVTVPTSAAEAMMAARDVDGDGTAENAFGNLVVQFGMQGATVQPGVTDGTERGNTLTLFSTSELNGVVDLAIYAGRNPMPPACDMAMPDDCGRHLTGSASFEAVTPGPDSRSLIGAIAAQQFTTETAGALPLALSINAGAQPYGATLHGATAEFAVVGGGLMNGVLAGGIEESELPVLRNMIAARILILVAADCQGAQPNCCTAATAGETLFALFDTVGDDCALDVAEITGSNLMTSLTTPDVDLFNNGVFEPGVDGIDDSLSFAVTFEAVGADFVRP